MSPEKAYVPQATDTMVKVNDLVCPGSLQLNSPRVKSVLKIKILVRKKAAATEWKKKKTYRHKAQRKVKDGDNSKDQNVVV